MAANTDRVAGSVVIIGAVLVMTIFAGLSDNLGKVLMIIMLGFLLLWLMSGGSGLVQKWLDIAGGGTKTV